MKAAFPNIDRVALKSAQSKLLLVRRICAHLLQSESVPCKVEAYEDLARLAMREYHVLRRMLLSQAAQRSLSARHPFLQKRRAKQLGRSRIRFNSLAITMLWSLRHQGATWTRIAKSMHLSRTTLYHQLKSRPEVKPDNVRNAPDYSALEDLIRRFTAEHPNSGERIILGHVRAELGWVRRQTVRDIIRLVDPVGVGLR